MSGSVWRWRWSVVALAGEVEAPGRNRLQSETFSPQLPVYVSCVHFDRECGYNESDGLRFGQFALVASIRGCNKICQIFHCQVA
jgi:hypothetical protein